MPYLGFHEPSALAATTCATSVALAPNDSPIANISFQKLILVALKALCAHLMSSAVAVSGVSRISPAAAGT